jgi:eukaryotic-like serine/threonine-protein kinase
MLPPATLSAIWWRADVIAPGTRIGDFEIVSHLGSGGMGDVYRARDSQLGRSVAIKVLASTFTDDPDRLARFDREARLLAALNHPNIATVHGSADFNGAARSSWS